MCWYLNGLKCPISSLLVYRDYATGNKEFVFVFFVWKHAPIQYKDVLLPV